jgi:hypothetical protein
MEIARPPVSEHACPWASEYAREGSGHATKPGPRACFAPLKDRAPHTALQNENCSYPDGSIDDRPWSLATGISGSHMAVIARFHLSFDDLFPHSLGKPIVGWF